MLIALYLMAIVSANLLVTFFGPNISILNAFLFIGLDITTRDALHEKWHKHLYIKMLLLIGVGSILSYLLNYNAGSIAKASFIAFLFGPGLTDMTVYTILKKFGLSWKERVNWSNAAGALVDSVLFPLLAFGWPLMWWIVLGQFVAKVAGGYIWSLILFRGKKDVLYL